MFSISRYHLGNVHFSGCGKGKLSQTRSRNFQVLKSKIKLSTLFGDFYNQLKIYNCILQYTLCICVKCFDLVKLLEYDESF